jgi:hypothetical protein
VLMRRFLEAAIAALEDEPTAGSAPSA